MITIDEYTLLAERAADELPEGMLPRLNGGILVSEAVVLHEASVASSPLYVLGQYKQQIPGQGRAIFLYYGSFARTYPYLGPEEAFPLIRGILFHEITHYLETLAGDRSLLDEDRREIEKYRKNVRIN